MSTTVIVYVGHATVLIETSGTRILTDPLLGEKVSFLRRCKYQIKREWFQSLDAVLISHKHRDHLDTSSLCRLDGSTRFIVPKDVVHILKTKGLTNVEGVGVDDCVDVGKVSVRITPAKHRSRLSSLRLGSSSIPVGFLVKGSHQVYFAGDTDLFDEMVDLGKNLDVALLPVWGWGPTLGPGHLNPKRAAEALKLLRPTVAIPIHWGTFHPMGMGWLKLRYLIEPPYKFAFYAKKYAPEVELRIIKPGEQTKLS